MHLNQKKVNLRLKIFPKSLQKTKIQKINPVNMEVFKKVIFK